MESTQTWTRYGDFYRHSGYAAFPQEHRESLGRLPFHMITVDQKDHNFIDPSVPETVIALSLSASPNNIWAWDMGSGWKSDSAIPGRMLALPSDNVSSWRVKGTRTMLVLTIPSTTIRQVLGPSTPDQISDLFRPLSNEAWEDSLVQSLMLRLWQSAAGRHATDRLLVDGALITLVTHLTQRADTIHDPIKYTALPRWRFNKVLEYVDAHMHDQIDIVALSDAAGLSVRHFSRAFSDEFGETPHKWLMRKRIEKATELIKNDKLPLWQVAECCGFTGQSHFTKTFKEYTGEPPKRWFNQLK